VIGGKGRFVCVTIEAMMFPQFCGLWMNSSFMLCSSECTVMHNFIIYYTDMIIGLIRRSGDRISCTVTIREQNGP
jgi:hypothetical protein